MADYWMKLYIEILDDPKMAVLPDRLWRRFFELCLLAKRLNNKGHLPETRQIAWALRMNPDDLEMDLQQLAPTKIVTKTLDGWFIPKFEARQRPATSTERVHQHRKRQQKQQYNGDETQLKRNVTERTEDRLTETESETETKKDNNNGRIDYEFGALCTVYEKNIGPLTQMLAEDLNEDLGEYGLQNCMDAISEALRGNVRKWSYVRGILRNWKRDGRNGHKPAQELNAESMYFFDVGKERQWYKAGELVKTEIIGGEL